MSALLIQAPWAQAMSLSGWGMLSYPNGGSTGTPGFKTSALSDRYGGGASVEYSLSKKWGFEFGLFYSPRGMKYVTPGAQEEQISFQALSVPILIRSTAFRNFGFGFGAYYSRALGASPSINQLGGLKKDDVGIVVSARIKAPLLDPFYLVGDLRYLHGLTSLSPSSEAQIFLRDAQLLLGLEIKL